MTWRGLALRILEKKLHLNGPKYLMKFGPLQFIIVRLSYYSDVMMTAMAAQITSLTIVYSTV